MRSRSSIYRSVVTISELAAHDADTARRNPEFAPKPVTYTPFNPLTLTALQQAALLSLFDDTHARRAVVRRLIADANDHVYSALDFEILKQHDLCERPHGYRFDKITGTGRAAAFTLQKLLCQRYGIHLKSGGNDNCRGLVTYRCSCGLWVGQVERNIFASSAGNRAFAIHVREALASKEAMDIIRTALQPMPKESA